MNHEKDILYILFRIFNYLCNDSGIKHIESIERESRILFSFSSKCWWDVGLAMARGTGISG